MLTEIAIRAAKPTGKARKMFDGRGLYLLVTPTGARLWRFKYQFKGREKLISLGKYPDTTLAQARGHRDDARRMVAAGTDPSAKRQLERDAQAHTFELVANDWLDKQQHLAASTIVRDRQRLEKFVYPYVGSTPVADLTAPALLAVLRRIEARDTIETAHRTKAVCGRVLRYAIARGRAERDVSADLKGALKTAKEVHHAALTDPRRIGELLRAIDGYVGQPTTMYALKLAPHVFVRPGELRAAEWNEFDLDSDTPTWRIRKERMKMKQEHIVPLSRQSVAILCGIKQHTGGGRLVFPSLRSGGRPMSENAILAALRRMGYAKTEQSGHGFRSIASTLLNEMGVNSDLVELQLAHQERDEVRAAYNRAQRLDERRKMMQAWSDHLDKLRAGDAKPATPQQSAQAEQSA